MSKYFSGCIIFLLSSIIPALSQKEIKDASHGWMMGGGPAVARSIITDKSFSSLPYSGMAAGGHIEAVHKGIKLLHTLTVGYTSGINKAAHAENYRVKNRCFNVDYTLHRQLTSASASHWYIGAGGGITARYANRTYNNFINSNKTFEFAASISASALLKYSPGKASNGFTLYNQLAVPAITYLMQPPFGYNNLVASGKSSFYSKDFVSPSSFFRINNRFGIEKSFGTIQHLSLAYSWDYYHLQKGREVRSAVHSIALTYYHSL